MTIKLAVGIPALFLLSACTGLSERLDGSIDETGSKVSTLVKDIGRTAPGVVMKSAPVVAREKGIWLGKNIVKLGQPALPSIFYENAVFDRSVNSLSELAERIALRSGVPTKVTPDALAVASGPSNAAQSGEAPAGPTAAAPAASAAAMQTPVRIAYTNGNFKGLLDTAAA
ncbi:MAG TPA: PilN family type IVB pilus formation outer membrane protein, partial [Noviherbaspirillum sp.]|nr:PilN family type IVB pilus formation outer membrane protein [Noviherbaspirillum sp.]